MEIVDVILNFIQDEVLKMNWLNQLIKTSLEKLPYISSNDRVLGSLNFFIYDVIKIIILLCVLIFIVSYIQSYFPPERSKRIMKRFHGFKANLVGALLGTITPFCSCSSIPIFMGFTNARLPLGVTFSFLISSPMVDLGSLVLLASIFSVKIALIYVILGILIAVISGSIIERLHFEDQVEGYGTTNPVVETELVVLTKKERLVYAKSQVTNTLKKVFLYIIIGVGIGAFIHNWIPEAYIERFLGENNSYSVVLATILGVPMYADIFGTIPIAEALLYKQAQLGTVLAFMMAVTTLSLPSIIMLSKVIKPKLLTVFVLLCVIGIIIVGYFFNGISLILNL